MSADYEARADVAIALDIGGTKIAGALVDVRGRCSHRVYQPTRLGNREVTLAQAIAVAEELCRVAEATGQRPVGMGVSVPAVVDAGRQVVIWAPNIPGWRDVPLGQMLQERTELDVQLEYDGYATTLGEAWLGAGQGVQEMLLVIIGTGIGGGLILGGRLHRGATNIAGALGWSVVDLDAATSKGLPGLYRQFGQLEALCAGPAIARRARPLLTDGRSSVLRQLTGGDPDRLTAREVLAAAAQGDGACQKLVRAVGETLGVALANAVTLLNPQLIVLSGGVGAAGQALVAPIQRTIRAHAQPVAAQAVRVVTSTLGNDGALLGAASLVFQHA